MKGKVFIRYIRPSDIDAVAAMAKLNMELSYPNVPYDDVVCRDTIAGAIERADPTMFVADLNGEAVGFLLATINGYRAGSGLFTCQEVMFVSPAMRGSRAAALLMSHFIAWSKSLPNVREIIGGNDNGYHSEQTKSFLGRFGFSQVGYAMKRVL